MFLAAHLNLLGQVRCFLLLHIKAVCNLNRSRGRCIFRQHNMHNTGFPYVLLSHFCQSDIVSILFGTLRCTDKVSEEIAKLKTA